ncbi:dehydrogenase [Lentzea sp. NBRC 105346]|uniref:SDR family oxidoreductase n=1 Tax=Lentzea sp. NBRC 105346 TaxID=3032205 RepID=UPI0024A5B415|nr:SDR family oxidoreductase [Lentzea sp. NBRC 105346]GLZ28237.1 dehydrogenase [Lentzea sp. NBRC 105346]
MDLTGKVALVTGGAAGIGAATAKRLGKLGAKVAVVDLDRDGAEKVAAELQGLAISGDVTDPDTMPSVVEQIERELGRLDVVHLNAGVGGGQAGIDDALDVQRYRKLMGVNVDHVVYGTCAAVPALRRQGGGRIVITASLAGIAAMPNDPLYTLSKHAVVGYARAAGAALGRENITVNALCPGFVDTLLLGQAKEEFDAVNFPLLTPEDIADALQAVLTDGQPGEAWIIQPGGQAGAYKFRGVPGAAGQVPPDVVLGRA